MASRREELEQIFEICLGQIQSGHETIESALARYPEAAVALRPHLEAALWLDERKGALDARAGFVSASRSRLVSQIKQDMAAQAVLETAPQMGWWARLGASILPRRRGMLQMTVSVFLLACVVLGGVGVSYAAQDALPGDPAYPVKIILEQAELATTRDTAEQARLHAEFAQKRLDEAQNLVLEGRYSYIPDTVGRFEYHLNQAVRLLHKFVREDGVRAKAIAASLSETLTLQTASLNVMIVAISPQYQPDVAWALSVTDSSLNLVDKVLILVGGTPRPTPTLIYNPTSTTNPTSTSIVQATSTPTPGFTPANTNSPIKTTTKTTTLTATLIPWSTSTYTATPRNTRQPTSLPSTPNPTTTNTPKPPTNTQPPPPTNTQPPPPTNTQPPPSTNTQPSPPTDTQAPPTTPPYPGP